jgi:hypothetical protein
MPAARGDVGQTRNPQLNTDNYGVISPVLLSGSQTRMIAGGDGPSLGTGERWAAPYT